MKPELFSKYAGTYDEYADIQKQSAAWIMASLDLELPENSRILDYGCGTGILTSLLLSRYPGAGLWACDISEAMLTQAQRKPELRNVSFFRVSREEDILTAAAKRYDWIVSNAVLHWIKEGDCLRSFVSALRPGGKIVFTAYGPDSFSELTAVLETHFKTKIRLPVSYFKDQIAWEKMINASLKNGSVEKRKFTLEYPDVRNLLRSIKFTGTTGRGVGFSHFWTPGDLKYIEKIFISMYKKIVSTYEIFLCSAFKPE